MLFMFPFTLSDFFLYFDPNHKVQNFRAEDMYVLASADFSVPPLLIWPFYFFLTSPSLHLILFL